MEIQQSDSFLERLVEVLLSVETDNAEVRVKKALAVTASMKPSLEKARVLKSIALFRESALGEREEAHSNLRQSVAVVSEAKKLAILALTEYESLQGTRAEVEAILALIENERFGGSSAPLATPLEIKVVDKQETSSRSSWKLVIVTGFAAFGFVLGSVLKPVLEAFGKAVVGRSIARILSDNELARALGTSLEEKATVQSILSSVDKKTDTPK